MALLPGGKPTHFNFDTLSIDYLAQVKQCKAAVVGSGGIKYVLTEKQAREHSFHLQRCRTRPSASAPDTHRAPEQLCIIENSVVSIARVRPLQLRSRSRFSTSSGLGLAAQELATSKCKEESKELFFGCRCFTSHVLDEYSISILETSCRHSHC